MQRVLILFLLIACASLVLMAQHHWLVRPVQGASIQPPLVEETLMEIEAYEDDGYGFSVAIPAGWRRIVTVESGQPDGSLEPSYAIGFESPHQGEHDLFADYILIEILPGAESGLFATDGSNRHDTTINGRPAWIDKVLVNDAVGEVDAVDLTVYQAEFSGLGYTVGLYAIGESARETLMSAAFKVLIETFRFHAEPFSTA